MNWRIIYKLLAILLLTYALVAGFLIKVPALPVIYESIRNLFYHVGMWFTMIFLFALSFIYSLRHLAKFEPRFDTIAEQSAHVGIVFGLLGIATGMLWANATWGAPWAKDPKLNGAAMSILVYLAYMVLRRSIADPEKRGRIAAVYNIFAFVLMVVFIGILPRLSDGSIHPGQGGSPMTVAELDNKLRLVFYPAIAGWILLGVWMVELRVRIKQLQVEIESSD